MLSNLLINKTKPQAKTLRLSDGRGMYLEISPNGGKWWRFKYRLDGKEKRISLGVYPDVGLAAARDKREEARRLVAAGIDPTEHRKATKVALVESTENTFEAIAREWFGLFSKQWVPGHADKIIRRLELNVFPWIGTRPIKAITAPELLAVLRRIEIRGANETAHRALQVCGRVRRCERSGRTRSVPGLGRRVGTDQGEASRLHHRPAGSRRIAPRDRCVRGGVDHPLCFTLGAFGVRQTG
jgi:Arm DNA-binding domain